VTEGDPAPEHPLNRRSLAYWLEKKGSRAMPRRADLDPAEIPDLLPHVLLIDILQEPLDFRYRLIGTTVEHHLSRPLTGLRLSELPHQQPGSVIWATLEGVVIDPRPISSRIPYVGPHRDYKVAEDVIMPLSDDGKTVNMLFVTVAYSLK